MSTNTPDRIEREMILNAPLDRVWAAITQPEQLTRWFGNRADFAALKVGESITFGWRDEQFPGQIAVVEPPHRFAFRWYSITANTTAPFEELPTTLVTFTLEATDAGTRLNLVESGFASLPVGARAASFKENNSGWNEELDDLRRYLTGITA